MPWTTPETFTAGQTLTAASMNVISGNLDAIGGAWTAYTPTWTNLTVGNGTNDSTYIAAEKLHIVRVKFTLGSTSSVGTGPEFTLPNGVSLSSSYNRCALGNASFFDTSVSRLVSGFVLPSITTATRVRFTSPVSGFDFAAISATAPFNPWQTGDIIEAQFMFEAA